MRTIGLGAGLIATILLPVALWLFGVLRPLDAFSAILLLSGIWALIFGLLMERKEERLYYSGFGAILALLSTVVFIPAAYTAGMVIVVLVALALVQAVTRSGASPSSPKA